MQVGRSHGVFVPFGVYRVQVGKKRVPRPKRRQDACVRLLKRPEFVSVEAKSETTPESD
jgi:hypothetical protein